MKMYQALLKRIQTPVVTVVRGKSSWTQGQGPNYSKNLIFIGIATATGIMISTVSIPFVL